jgi:hypothetical protein
MENFRKVLSKTVVSVYTAHTDGFAISGHRIKRGVAKLLEKFIKFNTYGSAIRGHRLKRGVAL